MKIVKNTKLTLMRNKFNQDLLYTSSEWPEREIDGIKFVSVKVRQNDSYLKLMRKDQLERVKQ
jgi:hypothetical protein